MRIPFFGSHEVARYLAPDSHAFLMMTKHSTYGVDMAEELLAEGQSVSCLEDDATYGMVVFKNSKVRQKPPRCQRPRTSTIRELDLCIMRSGNEVNRLVANYRLGGMASTRWPSRCSTWDAR